jgi:hypothetical protein
LAKINGSVFRTVDLRYEGFKFLCQLDAIGPQSHCVVAPAGGATGDG